jgi:predicted MPP superfamily phosphohydrolase
MIDPPVDPPSPPPSGEPPRRNGKYRRAAWRHLLVTRAADQLSGGHLVRRHLQQPVLQRRLEISSPRWPAAFDGLRVVHFSDLHLGSLLPLERALEVVELVRAEQPDLVAFTGDLVDLDLAGAAPLLSAIGSLAPRLGTHLVLGNHDHLDDPRELVRLAREQGISVLQDQSLEFGEGRQRLTVAGIDWGKGTRECRVRVDSVCNRTDAPVHLLLSHNPQSFPEASRRGIALTLAGHTHGGQVARRANPAHNFAIAHRFRSGFYTRRGSVLFVTNGVGAWFPLRLHCDPEVVTMTVRRGALALP